MSRRFFAPDASPHDEFVLSGEQAHHISTVMRFKPGEQIMLFDGNGREFPATILETGKKRVSLRVGQPLQTVTELSVDLVIAVALPKGDRQKFMVEKLVELGVKTLIPLKTQRSISEANAKVITRIEKQVIEASKQCGRNLLMKIGPEQTLVDISQSLDSSGAVTRRFIAIPDANESLARQNLTGSETVYLAIGPEGGFSPDELSGAIQYGWQPIGLGPTTLRIETAAIAATVIAANLIKQGSPH